MVYFEDNGVTRAFCNILGVELCFVDCFGLFMFVLGGYVG